MKVLVTGAAGMLGTDLMEAGRALRGAELRGFRRQDADLAECGALAQAAREFPAELIIHAAAYADVDGCEQNPERAWRENVEATRNVTAYAAERGALLVHVSTDYVFDGTATRPIPIDAPTSPVNTYGATKLEAEKVVKASGARFLIVRTAWLIGVHGPNFVEAIRKRARTDPVLHVVDDQRGTPTFTFDLAPALLELGQGKHEGVLHLTNAGECTRYEQAQEIIRLDGLGARVEPVSSEAFPRPARRPQYSVLDNSAANAILGKPLPSWRDSLAKYLRLRPAPVA